MSRSLIKIVVLGAMVVMAFSSTASATTWTSNGSRTFGATAGNTILKVDTPISGGLGANCTSASANGTLAGPTGPVNTGPWNAVAAVRPGFSGCTLAGNSATVNCGVATLNAATHVGSVVGGTLTNINCALGTNTAGICGEAIGGVVKIAGVRVTGTVNGQYDNATDVLKVLSGIQSLAGVVSNTPGCNAISGYAAGGTAPAHFGSAAGGVGNVSYAATNAPQICSNIIMPPPPTTC